MDESNQDAAGRLMTTFAVSSGVTGEQPPRRYLWTDAYAVCNFISLARAHGDDGYLDLARMLVDQVHQVLGRHRPDDSRQGWISGLDEEGGRAHPTAGGLRIGKRLPERQPGANYDPAAEWDQDGQYYHYLTKWMHALLQMAGATGEPDYLTWARELAVVACRRFRSSTGGPRLYWKMSIDLSHPLVPSSGLHDPLDGLVTALTLRAAGPAASDPGLAGVIEDLQTLSRGTNWATDDPLGIGGLLFDAGRLAQLHRRGDANPDLLTEVLTAASLGLASWIRMRPLDQPVRYRLAFRELGLGIGLQALPGLRSAGLPDPAPAQIERLSDFGNLTAAIERDWRDPASQASPTWTEHEDINRVMLATSLLPRGYLELLMPV